MFFFYLQALRYLGLEPNENQNKELYDRLNIDENDTVEYGGKIILAVVEIAVIWPTFRFTWEWFCKLYMLRKNRILPFPTI